MNTKLSTSRYLQQSGGWSAILSGLFFSLVSAYIYVFLRAYGFTPTMFDEHTLLHPWVADHIRGYRLIWILYFLAQLVLIPLPYVLTQYFKGENRKLNALTEVSKSFGIAAITLAALCPIIFYAASPLTAQAYVSNPSPQSQEIVLVISSIMTDIPKEIRLFSEVFLGVWLVLSGYLFRRSTRAQGIGWLTFVSGIWTLAIVTVKIFDPANPLEDFLGVVLAVNYVAIGVHLLKVLDPKMAPNQQITHIRS